jgi:hypothetical protein
MFEINQKEAKFKNLNTRTQFEGDESVGAVDIELALPMDADALDHFHKDLKSMIFMKQKNTDDPEQGDLMAGQEEENDGVIDWRFRELKQLNWDYQGEGYRFVIWKALADSDDIEAVNEIDVCLIMAKIDKFRFKPLAEGKVEVLFKVSCKAESSDVGRLFELQDKIIDITLEPPQIPSN